MRGKRLEIGVLICPTDNGCRYFDKKVYQNQNLGPQWESILQRVTNDMNSHKVRVLELSKIISFKFEFHNGRIG